MKESIKAATQVNWLKTLYINFKALPFKDAIKLPIMVWGKCRFSMKGGKIKFNCPIKRGVLRIGFRYETFKYTEPVEVILNGTFNVNGEVWIGSAAHIYVGKNAELTVENDSVISSCTQLTCTKKITLSEFARIGSFVEITDSNYHYTKNITTGAIHRYQKDVYIGKRNWIGMRVAILPGTHTPNNTIVAFGSVCNKDYLDVIPENSVMAGIPAKLAKEGVVRIFEANEEAKIDKFFEQTGESIYYDSIN